MLIKSYSEIVRDTSNQFRFDGHQTEPVNQNIINGEFSRLIGDKFEVEVFFELLSNITNRKRPSMIKINNMTKKAQISSKLILSHVPFTPKRVSYYQSKCGKEGLPWDIALIGDNKMMNISLKHRNCKIKHQRPFSTPKQTKDSIKGKQFHQKYHAIKDNFLNQIPDNFKTYSQIRKVYPKLVEEVLYQPVCQLIANYLNSLPLENIKHYFNFLMGVGPGYILSCYDQKVALYSNKSIIHFKLKKFKARAKGKYIYLQFTDKNQRVIRLSSRIHNSSKNILSKNKRLDLKMDTTIDKRQMSSIFDLVGVERLNYNKSNPRQC